MLTVQVVEIEGKGRLVYQSQKTLSPGGHLVIVTVVIGLLWLIKLRLTSISISNPLPPVESLLAALILAHLLTNLALVSNSPSYSTHLHNDNSKTQYISINTPNG